MSDTDNPLWDDIRNALFLLEGEIIFGDPIDKTKFPSAATKPTKKECYAALARALRTAGNEMYSRAQADPGSDSDYHPDTWRASVLWALANCFDPASNHTRTAEIKNRGKGYETDEARDRSIANLARKLRKGKGPKRAIREAAVLIGRQAKSVREARKRVAKRLREDRNKFR